MKNTGVDTAELVWVLYRTDGGDGFEWVMVTLHRTDDGAKAHAEELVRNAGRQFGEWRPPATIEWHRPNEDDFPGLDPERDWTGPRGYVITTQRVLP